MLNLAILGCGARGTMFARIAAHDGIKINAACDVKEVQLERMNKEFGVPEDKLFTNADKFFEQGKLADCLIISTLDGTHVEYAVKALDVGYDVLLEKPIALDLDGVIKIRDKAEATGRKVGVCHVLRYTPFYMKMKEIIDSGVIGRVMNINQTENVGYWHFSHAFVRGNWHNSKETCPDIL
ncbi:MAG: Gfo/Idh/MocA family oxidoreductase, partial [Clostridia bacterium]|nr:Gfo/Idh/MocA family oxidoreductase [Clostridia bacterium]